MRRRAGRRRGQRKNAYPGKTGVGQEVETALKTLPSSIYSIKTHHSYCIPLCALDRGILSSPYLGFSQFVAIMRFSAFLMAAAVTGAAALTIGSREATYTIELAPGETRTVTEAEKWALKKVLYASNSNRLI